MEGLFKLLFYLIVILIYVFSNAKKRDKWMDKIPEFPQQPPDDPWPAKDLPRPQDSEPEREGAFTAKENAPSDNEDEVVLLESSPYDVPLPRKKPRVLREKTRTPPRPEPAAPEPQHSVSVSPAQPEDSDDQAVLKSSIKEGILWSIVLEPPRALQPFNRKNPLNRR